jgi:hypothetical protein
LLWLKLPFRHGAITKSFGQTLYITSYPRLQPVRSLNTLSFLWRLIISRERFGILWARGGLGNQLFQISALSFFSKTLDFSPLIHPCNLRQDRDDSKPQYRSLRVEGLFASGKQKIDPSPTLELILRIIYGLYSKYFLSAIYDESKLLKSFSSSMPRLFFIQDYFQSQEYPDQLSNNSLKNLIRDLPDSKFQSTLRNNNSGRNSAMIHIRLTDSHSKATDKSRFLKMETILKKLKFTKKISELHIYSDDLNVAKELLKDFFVLIPRIYPEEFEVFSSSVLLDRFVRYDCIMASNSTLSWWACYLRSRLSSTEAIILADFDQKLMRSNWHSIKT